MIILSRRCSQKTFDSYEEKGYLLIDVTSKSDNATYQKFSPFYPHGKIPVPGMPGVEAESVEGIWQGLKRFENEGVDGKRFKIKNMKNVKRSVTKDRGRVIGHQYGDELLDYVTSRKQIYLPTYEYMLKNYMKDELIFLKQLAKENDNKLLFIDYETNDDVENTKRPLSHASLVIKAMKSL